MITGASDGVGAAAAGRLRRSGENVVVVGRSPAKTAAVAQPLGADFFVADFAELAQVRELAQQLLVRYPRIDVSSTSGTSRPGSTNGPTTPSSPSSCGIAASTWSPCRTDTQDWKDNR